MYRSIWVCAFLMLVGCDRFLDCDEADDIVSDIAPDETVVFFHTSGRLDIENQQWHLPVHGWIYEPEDSTVRKAAFETILEEEFDLAVTAQTESNFSRRLNLLIADNERGKRIVVSMAGKNYSLAESAENGHFEDTIVIPAEDVARHSNNGLVHYTAVTGKTESRAFMGAVKLFDPAGISIISDIDDTVKISNVRDRRSLLEHTFLLDFVAVPGMSELYREWVTEETGLHFVSSSPWQLYEPLAEFLDQSGFPWATFSLKPVRFRDETLFDLFRKGTETKPAAIEKILDRYPNRKFVLVGDSGEQDPEVYAALLLERPDQIVKVYLRNVTQESVTDDRFTALFSDIDPNRWQLFEDPQSLAFPGIR